MKRKIRNKGLIITFIVFDIIAIILILFYAMQLAKTKNNEITIQNNTIEIMEITPPKTTTYENISMKTYVFPNTIRKNVSLSMNEPNNIVFSFPDYETYHDFNVEDGLFYHVTDNDDFYKYLYYEINTSISLDRNIGQAIKGEDVSNYLENTLKDLGYTDLQINEFLTYWLPLVEHNKLILVTFYEQDSLLHLDNSQHILVTFQFLYNDVETYDFKEQNVKDFIAPNDFEFYEISGMLIS